MFAPDVSYNASMNAQLFVVLALVSFFGGVPKADWSVREFSFIGAAKPTTPLVTLGAGLHHLNKVYSFKADWKYVVSRAKLELKKHGFKLQRSPRTSKYHFWTAADALHRTTSFVKISRDAKWGDQDIFARPSKGYVTIELWSRGNKWSVMRAKS